MYRFLSLLLLQLFSSLPGVLISALILVDALPRWHTIPSQIYVTTCKSCCLNAMAQRMLKWKGWTEMPRMISDSLFFGSGVEKSKAKIHEEDWLKQNSPKQKFKMQ